MKKTALITGASSGIGKELARIHAELGGDLVIVARRQDKLEELKNELETQFEVTVTIIVKDLSVYGASEEIYNEVKASGIEIDYLLNNAGFGGRGKFHEREWEKDLAMMNVNMVALTTLTKLFLTDFVNRNEGKILNTSSTASLMPGPLQAVYFATKAYVTSFSNAIAEELQDTNITVTALLPGATETEFALKSDMDKTNLFANTSSARIVAEAGYNGMINGDLNVIAGLNVFQKIMMNILPLIPLKTKLKQIRIAQEVNK